LKRGRLFVVAFLLFNLGGFVVMEQFRLFAMRAYQIPSSAMEPTLHCARPGAGCEGDTNDRIFVVRFVPFWTPSRGDVIAFKTPPLTRQVCGSEGTFVKRLIGLPGDVWEERQGTVLINGERLSEGYIRRESRDSQTLTMADVPPRGRYTRIPKGYYLMMGDNRSSSCDSRRWGLVARSNFIGPVVARYWPFERLGLL
jgi:signal peptidase I